MKKSGRLLPAMILAAVAAAWVHPIEASVVSGPIIASGLNSFDQEEPTVLYFPSTNTFTSGDTYKNIVDEGGGMIRETLRNYLNQGGWWDGDRNGTDNSTGSSDINRQRAEVKNLGGTTYRQKTDETYEYSYDFRTDPEFVATGHFCHIFQLKATDEGGGVGSSGLPLVTLSLYKSGSVTLGRLQYQSGDAGSSTIARTFTFTPGEWIHAVIRISTTNSTETNGVVMASINGDAFTGASDVPVYRTGATTYYNKWGFYRGMGVDYGVPPGDSWVEDRTVTLLKGTTNILNWQGGVNANAWDAGSTQNWLNGSAASAFNIADQVRFDDTSTNNTVNLVAAVSPNYITFDSTKNYTFSGTGKISGGTLVKKNTGTLTLATTNDYPGLTEVQGGTLLVTGSIGNNSLAWITGGTLRAGSSAALGTNSTIGTTIIGGTLDINGQNLSTEPITVQGTGVGGNGAIVNSGSASTTALTVVTLSGDATFGGTYISSTVTGRWDIRNYTGGPGASLSTGGNSYNLTKVGLNQVSFVATTVDAALGNININQGILGFQTGTNSMGDPNKTVTIASGATLELYNTTYMLNKKCVLNGGTIWAESGAGTQNIFSGPITVNSDGGIFDAGGGLTGGAPIASAILTLSGAITGVGGVTKNGPGTVFITRTPGYNGNTIVTAGILQINSHAAVSLHAVTGAGALGVDNTTSLTVDSINIGTLTLGIGSRITIAPLAGGPTAGMESFSPVPEPATWAMLLMAAMGLGIYRRRSYWIRH
jgi:autotransporter-associated beta strand protein